MDESIESIKSPHRSNAMPVVNFERESDRVVWDVANCIVDF